MTKSTKLIGAVAVVCGVLALASPAFADDITDAFTSMGTSSVSYAGLAIGVILAVALLGIGLRFAVKAAKKLASAL